MDQVGLPIVLAWQLGRTSRVRLAPRPPRRRPDRREGPGQRAGALGEPGGLLARHDRGRDRGADLRGGHRAQERSARPRRELRAHGRLVGAQRRALDGDEQRPVRPEALLPAPDQGPQAEPRHDLQHRRLRAVQARPAPRRRRQLPRAGPARRQAPRRPGDPEHAAGRRPAAEGRRVLAPVQLRRLRRAPRRRSWRLFDDDTRTTLGPRVADLRRRARRVRAARGPLRRPPTWRRWRPRATAAGCCPSRSGTAARRPANRASPRARGRSRRPRWPGPTRSSSGSRGPPRQGLRSSARRSLPTATRGERA